KEVTNERQAVFRARFHGIDDGRKGANARGAPSLAETLSRLPLLARGLLPALGHGVEGVGRTGRTGRRGRSRGRQNVRESDEIRDGNSPEAETPDHRRIVGKTQS